MRAVSILAGSFSPQPFGIEGAQLRSASPHSHTTREAGREVLRARGEQDRGLRARLRLQGPSPRRLAKAIESVPLGKGRRAHCRYSLCRALRAEDNISTSPKNPTPLSPNSKSIAA